MFARSFMLLFGLFSICACQQTTEKNTDWKRLSLKKKVQRIDEKKYSINIQKEDSYSIHKFNEEGNITYLESREWRNTHSLIQKTTYQGDSAIAKTTRVYGPSPQDIDLAGYTVQYFDPNGNIILFKAYDQANNQLSKKLFTLNEQGNIQSTSFSSKFHQHLSPCSEQMKYNEQHQLVERYNIPYNKELNRCASEGYYEYFSYNKKGDFKTMKVVLADGRVESQFYFIYEYDNSGNWIKKTGYDQQDKFQFIMTREITYYE